MAYLTLTTFKDLSLMPSGLVDDLEAVALGWVDKQLAYWSAWIDSRLAKRYAVPFDAVNPPVAVTGWLARIVTLRVYLRRGVDATDEQFVSIQEDARAALDEIKEAAESVEGLFDLPLRSDTTASGIARGGSWSYSEASPYVGLDAQRTTARGEDSNGGGTYG